MHPHSLRGTILILTGRLSCLQTVLGFSTRFSRFRLTNGPNWWNEFSIVLGKCRIKKGWRGGRLRRNRALMQLIVENLKQYQEKKYLPALDEGIHEAPDSPLWNELVYTP